MTPQLDEKRHIILAILSLLRQFNPAIGQYEKSILHSDFQYHVLLNNGRIQLPQEMIDDYEKHPSFVSEDTLKNIALRFQPSAGRTVDNAPSVQSVPEVKSDKSFRTIINRTLGFISLVGIIVFGIIIYNQIRETQHWDSTRANIYNRVTAEGSRFTYNELGGIYNFRVTVTNNTKYVIDKVAVKVIYIKTNGDTWKEELLEFTYLMPYESQTLKAPDSSRGTSLKYQIVSITSQALELY